MSLLDVAMLRRAARTIARADALLIGAGAGMGVDSGLPDFRGTEGFWRAYPPFAKLGLRFEDVADPAWFSSDPALAWGFYGHRGNLYRTTRPHEGFKILRKWSEMMRGGSFVLTSNVDDHFARAGFRQDRILEVHGSIEWRQCLARCGVGIFPAREPDVVIDESTFRAEEPWPACPGCQGMARPNILMFGDAEWDSCRSEEQRARYRAWIGSTGNEGCDRLAIIELGAGRSIPTIRLLCELIAHRYRSTLIRINPREPEVPLGQISFAADALATLKAIDELMPIRPDEWGSDGQGLDEGKEDSSGPRPAR